MRILVSVKHKGIGMLKDLRSDLIIPKRKEVTFSFRNPLIYRGIHDRVCSVIACFRSVFKTVKLNNKAIELIRSNHTNTIYLKSNFLSFITLSLSLFCMILLKANNGCLVVRKCL